MLRLTGAFGIRAAATCFSTMAPRIIPKSSDYAIDRLTNSLRGEPLKLTMITSASDKMLSIPQLCILPNVISIVNVPLPQNRREIIDPLSPLRYSKEPPPNPRGQNEISLPENAEKEMVDPVNNVIEKRAARLIVIRRAKMKKHKWKKLQKKMKFVFAKRRQRRELKKEKAFQAVLVAKVKEAEKFNAEAFVARQLEIAHWERPVTHVRNRRAPDWVIRNYLQEEEEKRRVNERIEQCLQFKKQQ